MGKTKTAFVGEEVEEKKSLKKPKEKPAKVHIAGLKGGQRIKVVEAQVAQTEELKKEGPKEEKKKAKAVKVRGKKYQAAKTKIESGKLYPEKDAITLVKETSYSAFDGTVELHLVVKKVGISAQVTLPFSAGKEKKIEVASDKTLEKLEKGKIDFDLLLATAEMMPRLIPFARTLGPKGLMPNPKNGTIIKSEKDAAEFSGNTITLKTEKEAPLIHTVIGKVSQKDSELTQNLEAILKALGGPKQILKAYVKATMGPSVKLALT